MDAFFEDISANNVPTPPTTQTTGPQPAQTTGPNNEFEELLSRSTQKLYPGCDMTTLEFTTEISHIKALHKITDAGFNKILALLQKACSPSKGYSVSTPWLDGEMYYGQLEEILELTYIGHRKVVLFRCKWFDTINPKNHTTRNRRSYIDQGIHHILTDREFHKNNQYILATQATQVFYLQDLARQPRGWKVVEHVYHRDVAESDQDVIHGSSSSHVTLSVGLTCLEHTDLSINAQSTEVDAPPVNDDNANANEDNADFINNEDDVVAHCRIPINTYTSYNTTRIELEKRSRR
ncbi:Myc-type, basic helix-loop-helix domain-containing protein [Tanacetum coccineum]